MNMRQPRCLLWKCKEKLHARRAFMGRSGFNWPWIVLWGFALPTLKVTVIEMEHSPTLVVPIKMFQNNNFWEMFSSGT